MPHSCGNAAGPPSQWQEGHVRERAADSSKLVGDGGRAGDAGSSNTIATNPSKMLREREIAAKKKGHTRI